MKDHVVNDREQVLAEAVRLIGDHGHVRDYACDCEPGGERFIVEWHQNEHTSLATCYNIHELRVAILDRRRGEDGSRISLGDSDEEG